MPIGRTLETRALDVMTDPGRIGLHSRRQDEAAFGTMALPDRERWIVRDRMAGANAALRRSERGEPAHIQIQRLQRAMAADLAKGSDFDFDRHQRRTGALDALQVQRRMQISPRVLRGVYDTAMARFLREPNLGNALPVWHALHENVYWRGDLRAQQRGTDKAVQQATGSAMRAALIIAFTAVLYSYLSVPGAKP